MPRREWNEGNRSPVPTGFQSPPDDQPEYCTGYLSNLQPVREAMQVRFWKDSPALNARLKGQEPTMALLDMVESLEVSNAELLAYKRANPGAK